MKLILDNPKRYIIASIFVAPSTIAYVWILNEFIIQILQGYNNWFDIYDVLVVNFGAFASIYTLWWLTINFKILIFQKVPRLIVAGIIVQHAILILVIYEVAFLMDESSFANSIEKYLFIWLLALGPTVYFWILVLGRHIEKKRLHNNTTQLKELSDDLEEFNMRYGFSTSIGFLVGGLLMASIFSVIAAKYYRDDVRYSSVLFEDEYTNNTLLEVATSLVYVESLRRGEIERTYEVICSRLNSDLFRVERAASTSMSAERIYSSMLEHLDWLDEQGYCN